MANITATNAVTGRIPENPSTAPKTREPAKLPAVKTRHVVPNRYFASLACRVMSLKPQRGTPTVIGVATCGRGEGGTTIASNLAMALHASTTGDVLVINAVGMNKPSRQRRSGWIDFVLGRVELLDAVQVTDTPRLYLMGIGNSNPKSRLIYNPERLTSVMQSLKSKFAFIIVDLPTAHESMECMPLAKELDGVLLVIKSGKSTSSTATKVHELFQNHGANVFGVVLNQTRSYVPRILRYCLGLSDPNQ